MAPGGAEAVEPSDANWENELTFSSQVWVWRAQPRPEGEESGERSGAAGRSGGKHRYSLPSAPTFPESITLSYLMKMRTYQGNLTKQKPFRTYLKAEVHFKFPPRAWHIFSRKHGWRRKKKVGNLKEKSGNFKAWLLGLRM